MANTYGNKIAVFPYLKFNDYVISEMINTIKNISENVNMFSFYCARFGFGCQRNLTFELNLSKYDFRLDPSFLTSLFKY